MKLKRLCFSIDTDQQSFLKQIKHDCFSSIKNAEAESRIKSLPMKSIEKQRPVHPRVNKFFGNRRRKSWTKRKRYL